MDRIRVKLVPYSLPFLVCFFCHIGLILNEPVEHNAPAAPNTDLDPSRTIFDQRQTGKYNIHLSIKDVAIIDVDQNSFEDVAYDADDYYYDEGHVTIKPVLLYQSTTQKQPSIASPSTIDTTTMILNPSSIFTSTIPTTISNNQNFSQNHFSDIAETNENNKTSSNATLSDAIEKNLQNIVGLDTQNLTHGAKEPLLSSDIQARSEDVFAPLSFQERVIARPHSFSKRPHSRLADASQDDNQHNEKRNNSNIYKFKIRRAEKLIPFGLKKPNVPLGYPIPNLQVKRCRRNQYRDSRGDCRAKRSSILKKLFNMLLTLPFPDNERENGIDDRDDE